MDKSSSFCIVIPTYNRFDLLLPALLYYVLNFPETKIVIYDNGCQRIKERLEGIRNVRGNRRQYEKLSQVIVLGGNGKNIGVSAAWNILLQEAFETHACTHALVLNDDVYLDRNEISVNSLLGNIDFQNNLLVCLPTFDWSVFIMPKYVYNKVGPFDEGMFLYYSDNDMAVRLKKIGIDVIPVPFLNPAVFSRSSTILQAPELNEHIERDKQHYISKWGGAPGSEL